MPFEYIYGDRGDLVTGDTGKFLRGEDWIFPGEGLIPCRFLWVYQILKSRNASFCSFLLSTHAGFYILSICSKYAKPAYAVLRTQRGCPVLLGFACDAHAHRFALSNPLVAAKRKRRRIHVLHSFSDGGWVYQILKSRNASFCSFLLYSHAGFYILSVCSKYAKAAYAILRTLVGLPCASRLRLRCSRTSLP